MRQNTAAQLDQAKVRLARAVGATDGTPPAVDGQLAVQPIAFAPVAVMQARVRQVAPELAESRTAIEKSREELSLEQWKAVPDLKIGPRYRSELGGSAHDDSDGAAGFKSICRSSTGTRDTSRKAQRCCGPIVPGRT